jgi:hypothetical protein
MTATTCHRHLTAGLQWAAGGLLAQAHFACGGSKRDRAQSGHVRTGANTERPTFAASCKRLHELHVGAERQHARHVKVLPWGEVPWGRCRGGRWHGGGRWVEEREERGERGEGKREREREREREVEGGGGGRGEGEERAEGEGEIERGALPPTQALSPTCRMHVRKMVPCMSSFSTAATRASSSDRLLAVDAYLKGAGVGAKVRGRVEARARGRG